MARLILTRGLPGSGKSTWAREQQAADPNLWRINRDDLRAMVLRLWAWGNRNDEDLLTLVQHAAIGALLEHSDVSVIVDDTNLDEAHYLDLVALAEEHGAEFVVQDFRNVPIEVCITRDAARDKPVGAEVITRMHDRYLAPKFTPGEPFRHPALGPMPGYVAGTCGHRVAQSEWNAGYRTCERCVDEADFLASGPGHGDKGE